MNQTLDLKVLERKAYRSTFQDGIWDLYLAALMVDFALLELISRVNDTAWVMLLGYTIFLGGAFALFMLGKKFITLPRLGNAQFGQARKRKKLWLVAIMILSVLFNVYLVLLTSGLLTAPQWLLELQASLTARGIMDVVVKAFIGCFVFTILFVTSFFLEFYRGMYIAALFGLGIFLDMSFDQPVIMLGAAALAALPGVILLVRFIQTYPVAARQVENGSATTR